MKEQVNWQDISQKINDNFMNAMQTQSFKSLFPDDEMQQIFNSYFGNPEKMMQMGFEMWQDYLNICDYAYRKTFGLETNELNLITTQAGDRRFAHDQWNENLIFDCIKQGYLSFCNRMVESAENNEQLDEQVGKKYQFFLKQWLDAMAPTNFVATNPAVIEKTVETNGQNLINGLSEMWNDFERGKGERLMTRMTDYSQFEVGKNVATTPGKVIFENELFQLIQYTPTTDKVAETPLLIVPPFINKYYILDLRKENSFVQWAVDQGNTVFIVSWVNPDEEHGDTQFDDYMAKGILTAVEMVRQECEVEKVNTIGYCIGGTVLAATNAYLATQDENPINTSTYFTTLLDFSDPGDLGVFVDEAQLAALDNKMEEKGYLDGSSMASVFNMLRANDLIWPFFINNYLMGEEPTAFDLLYWNSDSTRLPASTHSYYLRQCYLHNNLCKPNGTNLCNTDIDLTKVNIPSYFISTHDDHIAPWKSTYEGTQIFSGDTRFVLGGSGHIAGVINPPFKNKYGYWTNDKLDKDADKWLDKATQHEGSWWPDWQDWLNQYNGEQIDARIPGKNLKVIEEAPGRYVKKRIVPD